MSHHNPDSDTIVVVDYGGQTAQLITRRVREHGVYCELIPWDASSERIDELEPRGFILSGGPNSVYEEDAPDLPAWVGARDVPVLGICYGMQLLAHARGGAVAPSQHREYGLAEVELDVELPLFQGLPPRMTAWMSHGDRVEQLPEAVSAPWGIPATPPWPSWATPEKRRVRRPVPSRGRAHPPRLRPRSATSCARSAGARETGPPPTSSRPAVAEIREEVGDGNVCSSPSPAVSTPP